jgi:undecaprenyl-phosphate 4-deoxy-4-formamido-L-arabinose transferase
MRNYGQYNATLCGVRAARYNVIVTLDDDLQNPPGEIPKLLAKINEGYDVVYGTPAQSRHSLWRRFSSMTVRVILRHLLRAEMANEISAFRAFRTNLRDAFSDYRSPFVSLDVLFTWATTRAISVTVQHHAREHGTSKYSFAHLFAVAMNLMTAYSLLPLRLATINGVLCVLLGTLVLIGLFIHQLIFAYGFGGISLIAAMMCFLSGAQLISIGVLGEYLARIHSTAMSQPPYVIRNKAVSHVAKVGQNINEIDCTAAGWKPALQLEAQTSFVVPQQTGSLRSN